MGRVYLIGVAEEGGPRPAVRREKSFSTEDTEGHGGLGGKTQGLKSSGPSRLRAGELLALQRV